MHPAHLALLVILGMGIWLSAGCLIWSAIRGRPDFNDHSPRCVALFAVGVLLTLFVVGFV